MKQVKKIQYFVPTKLEFNRYCPDALSEMTNVIPYYERIIYFLFNLYKKKLNNKILLNGNRYIDIEIAENFLNCGINVNILQHGKHLYASNKLSLKQFIFKTVFRKSIWILVVLLVLLRIFKAKKQAKATMKVFYFTADFRHYFEKKFLKMSKVTLNFVECSCPNPLVWGTVTPIETIPFLQNFYVDEPLSETLGFSDNREILEILKVVPKDQCLYVKPHPRSHLTKFKNLERVKITDKVPEKTYRLFGFKSNLLDFQFDTTHFFQIKNDCTLVKGSLYEKNIEKKKSLKSIENLELADLA